MRFHNKTSVTHLDLESESWQPLNETERLDSYYHHCEMSGVPKLKLDMVRAEQQRSKPERKYMYDVSAESLGSLPNASYTHTGEAVKDVVPSVVTEEATRPPQLPPIRQYATEYSPVQRGAPQTPRLRVSPSVSDELISGESRVITFADTVAVDVESPTKWSTIKYSLDGSPISARSSAVCEPGKSISITQDATLRVASCKRGWLSQEIEVKFVKTESPAAPAASDVIDQGDAQDEPSCRDANSSVREAGKGEPGLSTACDDLEDLSPDQLTIEAPNLIEADEVAPHFARPVVQKVAPARRQTAVALKPIKV